MRLYQSEIEGQSDFYNSFLQRIDPKICMSKILDDHSDGVLNGNIIEFKLIIKDVSSALFQAIKYLSSMRIKGKSIPARIILISLNESKAYYFDSIKYINEIETVYIGAASKSNNGFQVNEKDNCIDFSKNIGSEKLVQLLKDKNFIKINIDENCIVGWAKRYYRENPGAPKSSFIGDEGKIKIKGEIRSPYKFENYINPYMGETNEKFRYLMDKLNENLQRKKLGAFYTPPLYSRKAAELVREAIKRVPKGNYYVIIDRCAGTGNLEEFLTDDELSNCIVSTYEYYEYKVLMETLGSKVKHIIPPKDGSDIFLSGNVRGADALSESYLNEEIIRQYINDPKCTIILYENPPFAETTSHEHQSNGLGKVNSEWKKSYIVEEMKKEVKGVSTNDMANAFIWSAFKYYLRQETDSYIVFSPIKYWKSQHLINKEFISGYGFNRAHFNSKTKAFVMCALWSNRDADIDCISLDAFDISENELRHEAKITEKRIHSSFSKEYYDKRKLISDTTDGIVCGPNGRESFTEKVSIKAIYGKDILGYLVADSSGFDNADSHSCLLSAGKFNGHGFYLRKDNYLEKLPVFAATRFTCYNPGWINKSRVMKSGDGSKEFQEYCQEKQGKQYLLKCLLFSSLTNQNHMRTFSGSDGRFYRNELCLDTSNGETVASLDLKNLVENPFEIKLIAMWNSILNRAKINVKYRSEITYGVYQIHTDLNSFKEVDGERFYDDPILNGNLKSLRDLLKIYYNKEILPSLFEYQFLK